MASRSASEATVELNIDTFLKSLIRTLSGTLEDVVGVDEASGFISVVGRKVGSDINDQYRHGLDAEQLDQGQVAEVLVDLKARIGGDFYIIESDDEKIVLGNRRCPFGDKVIGRPSMCMMTSNVFGVIAADNLGYGAVELQETIADGAPRCLVTVHLSPEVDGSNPNIREYFKE